MRIIKHPVYIFFVAIYIVLAALKMNHVPVPYLYIDQYFADLLCVPLLLSTTLSLVRKIKKAKLIFNVLQIMFVVMYVSIVFEYILPKYSQKYTADILDVIMYTIGGIAYYFIQKTKPFLN